MSDSRGLVLVVGSARSGTSAFTGVLAELGFTIPEPQVEADETNPRGFGEPLWVVEFHRRLMRPNRVAVFDARPQAWEALAAATADAAVVDELRTWLAGQFERADAVVVKDPRTAWLLPLWIEVSADLGVPLRFVTTLRAPAEVVASARQWYGGVRHEASRLAGWLNVLLHTELATRGARRSFVRYDDLVADWRAVIGRVEGDLALGLGDLPADAARQVDEFIDPALQRQRVGWDSLDVPARLRDLADDAWDALIALVDEPDGAGSATGLDRLRADYVALYRESEQIAQSSVVAARGGKRGKRARR